MQVLNCDFPDDRYYDTENDVWFKPEGELGGRVGITTILSFLAGKILKTKLKARFENCRSWTGPRNHRVDYLFWRHPFTGYRNNIQNEPGTARRLETSERLCVTTTGGSRSTIRSIRIHYHDCISGRRRKRSLEARIRELQSEMLQSAAR